MSRYELREKSLGSLVKLVRREVSGEAGAHVVVYLDEGATEAVRWAGGLVWAISAMGLSGPECLRQLGQKNSSLQRFTTAIVVLCERITSLESAQRAAGEARRVVVACDACAQEVLAQCTAALVIVEGASPRFAAPLCALDEEDDVELPVIVTLTNSRLAAAFPSLSLGGKPRADQLSDVQRHTLREMAGTLARVCFDLGLDARRRVFAVGPTSRLVGTAALSELEATCVSATPASLVLVDRTVDLSLQDVESGSFVSRALEWLPRQGWAWSAEPTVDAARWTTQPCGEDAQPLPACREIETAWPIPLSVAVPSARHLARAAVVNGTDDGGVALVAEECERALRNAGHSPAPRKHGRGPGAHLFEQLKRLVRLSSAPDGLVALAACAVEVSQRTKKRMKLDKELKELARRLFVADALPDDIIDVAVDALERGKASPAAAITVALAALSRSEQAVRDTTLRNLAGALERKSSIRPSPTNFFLDPTLRLPSPLGTLPLLAHALLKPADRHVNAVCVPVGGALESFGAAIGDAIGISRFLKHSASAAVPRDADVIIFFVVGGITLHEIADTARCLQSEHLPTGKLVIASTALASTEQIARLFCDQHAKDNLVPAVSSPPANSAQVA